MTKIKLLVFVLGLALCTACRSPADGDNKKPPAKSFAQTVTGRVLTAANGAAAKSAIVEFRDISNGKKRTFNTDARGNYICRDLPIGVYSVTLANRPAGVATDGQILRVGLKPVHAKNLYLHLPQSISGTIRDEKTGKPVAGVRLLYSTSDNNWDAVSTDAKGNYKLYVTPREVTIRCDGTETRYYPIGETEQAQSKWRKLNVKKRQQIPQTDFQVRSGPKCVGRITAADGKPLKGIQVLLQFRVRSTDNPFGFAGISSGTFGDLFSPRRCVTNDKGEFFAYVRRSMPTRRKLKWLDVTVLARNRTGSEGECTELTFAYPAPLIPMGTIRLKPTASVDLKLVDQKGKPLAHAKPALAGHFQHGMLHTGYYPSLLQPRIQSLGDGRFRVSGLYSGRKYHFDAVATGYRVEKGFTARVMSGKKNRQEGTVRLRPSGQRDVPRLIKMLSNADRYKRETACGELGELGADAAAAIPALRERLKKDKHNTVRYSAAAALGRIGPNAKAAVPDLIAALKTDALGVDREAAKALGLIGAAVAVPALGQAMKLKDRDVKMAAVVALGRLAKKSPKAIEHLVGALDDKDYNVRRKAAKWLGEAGPAAKPAVPALLRHLDNNKRYYFGPYASKALGQIGDPAALPALRRALHAQDDWLFAEAARAIRLIETADRK